MASQQAFTSPTPPPAPPPPAGAIAGADAPSLHTKTSLVSIPTGHQDAGEDYDDSAEKGYTSTNPCSAFYSHPPTRTSLEQRKSESRANVASLSSPSSSNVNLARPPPLPSTYSTSSPLKSSGGAYPGGEDETKVDYSKAYEEEEAAAAAAEAREPTKVDILRRKACTMWPSPIANNQKHSHRRQRSRKNLTGTIRGSRACAPYRRLSRKQRWAVQILLALLVVGLGVGVGVGISRAVGAGVWKSDNSSYEIPPEGGK